MTLDGRFMIVRSVFILCVLGFSLICRAENRVVDVDASKITFSGEHAGSEFTGTFKRWQALISIESGSQPRLTNIEASFDLASATTGNKMHDGTLPEEDWFYVEKHPSAKFVSTGISEPNPGQFQVTGDFTLRGVTKPLDMTLSFSDLSASPIQIQGTFDIDRLVYGVGLESDPEAEWVSRNIQIILDLQAQ